MSQSFETRVARSEGRSNPPITANAARYSRAAPRAWTLCASIKAGSINDHEKLNYVEFASANLPATKSFFEQAFNWTFVDYGPEYTAFSGQGLDLGFFKADMRSSTFNGAAPERQARFRRYSLSTDSMRRSGMNHTTATAKYKPIEIHSCTKASGIAHT